MNTIENEPVVEQARDDNTSAVSEESTEISPTTSNETVEKELTADKKVDINYLDASLFKDIKEVSEEELIEPVESIEELPNQDKYLSTFSDISEREIISGRVIGINEKEVLIDIGFKSEGIINRDEFSSDELPDVGGKIDVYLERMEDESGKTVLSKEKADFLRRWIELRKIHDTGEIITGKIVKRIKGGMVVDLKGVQAFLPGSQIDVRPVKDFDKYLDVEMDLKVVKFNEMRKNVVVSHKAILEESLAEKRDEIFSTLEVGAIMEGRVKNITDFGVFIDLGGIDGLLHITDLSWGRVNHPSEMISMDDTLSVKVIDFDDEKKRVSLGLKQLTPHPWETIETDFPKGEKVTGKVVSMTNYGAFIEIKSGIEGLIHVSEMSWTRHVKNPSELYSLGDQVEAVVLSIDAEERKISLGAKQLTDDPWDKIEEKYNVGSIVKGKVINLTQFGAFVELEEGIDGLIHVSDFSWTKVVRHPREMIEKDQTTEVRILEVSRESRRISLGIKQLNEDPWPELINQFQTGSEHEGEIVKILDKGIILLLESEIEGIIPFGRQTKKQRKEITQKYSVGEKISGSVLEVKPENKKVILFSEELSDKNIQKDEIKDFLDNQEEPAGERIEIPEEIASGESAEDISSEE
ncbi:MAG: 30S ribosomal protein S1 [Candidatus Neomarinimicrobiota bacterium]|nr:30S ribosomal protein S1 [Candidatus Neomarinimicrobiota bacterium]|tara:strand:+ start:6109 stop:8019 length:1911 start_codon:yes stop_codon:yes gene_type:complete